MLTKLQPEGSTVSQASRSGGAGDNDPTTCTLQDTMERLHGQHLSGSGEGPDVGGAFTTPAGARCPQGRSPPNEVRLDCAEWCSIMLVGLQCLLKQ